MNIIYKGKKNPLDLKLPYLTRAYSFTPDVETEVDSDDGRILVDRFPQTFKSDSVDVEVSLDAPVFTDSGDEGVFASAVLEVIKEMSEDMDSENVVEPELATDEDFTFELDEKGENFLCPLCEKTYKVNKGRGKYVMVEHLEKDHAEEWLELQTRPEEDKSLLQCR